MAGLNEIINALNAKFPGRNFETKPLICHGGVGSDQLYIRVEPADLSAVLLFLRDNPTAKFEQLIDLTCVDYLSFPNATDRYGVNYSLLSVTLGHRLWVKCFVNDPAPKVASATNIWPGANWMEREVFDMFGIVFEGHPDLRRILTWDTFKAHPLRKDYPLRGQGEREDYEVVTRESA
ncbi:MAG: NADH-quinone oxidoreductase subunit C [Planctomycetes bacterium]|nr:NADH-quinone oxidoreductase subunit C [Planctomycetota bacterium]